MRTFSFRWMLAISLFCASVAQGYTQNPTNPVGGRSRPIERNLGGSGPVDPNVINMPSRELMTDSMESPMLTARREALRKVERKKHRESDAKKLLMLTEQFHTETMGREELTDADVKRLDEIAKLARSVKELMNE